MELVIRPNSAIKLAREPELKPHGNFLGPQLTIYEMPEERSIHVATRFDLACAEAFLNLRAEPSVSAQCEEIKEQYLAIWRLGILVHS
jgi:CMP-N-acetylneuraminic acid synthetase